MAKGPERNAGREQFFLPGREPFMLEPRDPVLFFLQRLRDEAHRFAIGTHRAKRAKDQIRSPLDEIPGIGAARKKDRKSVVQGKSVSVRVDLGGRRSIKKKNLKP